MSTDIIRVDDVISIKKALSVPTRQVVAGMTWAKPGEIRLIDLIGMCLNRKTLDQLVIDIDSGASPSSSFSSESSAYLSKILKEEVQRQFSEATRPLVELVLNAIDARPSSFDGVYAVDISFNRHNFTVVDNGKGMKIEKILDTLLIPFCSDKDYLENIGRFGTGFFSVLSYCTNLPKKAILSVRSSDGDKSYEIRSHAKTGDVRDIFSSVRRLHSNPAGTTATVSGIKIDIERMNDYLQKYLEFFDSRRAVIRINGSPVNIRNSRPASYSEYAVPVEIETASGTILQYIRVGIDVLDSNKKIGLYSQGIFVQSLPIEYGRIFIDLPSGVKLVEGRDEFKRDENFYRCIGESLRSLIKYGEDNQHNPTVLASLRESIPLFAERMFRHSPSFTNIKNIIFPGIKYIMFDTSGIKRLGLTDFFGDEIINQVYFPRTKTAADIWGNLLYDPKYLISDQATPADIPDEAWEKLVKIVSQALFTGSISYVRLNSGIRTRSPVIRFENNIFVNVDHPFVLGSSYAHVYGLKTALIREANDEQSIESRLV